MSVAVDIEFYLASVFGISEDSEIEEIFEFIDEVTVFSDEEACNRRQISFALSFGNSDSAPDFVLRFN